MGIASEMYYHDQRFAYQQEQKRKEEAARFAAEERRRAELKKAMQDRLLAEQRRVEAAMEAAAAVDAPAAPPAYSEKAPDGIPICILIKPDGLPHLNEIETFLTKRCFITIAERLEFKPTDKTDYALRVKLRGHYATLAEGEDKERMLDRYSTGGLIVLKAHFHQECPNPFSVLLLRKGMVRGMFLASSGVEESNANTTIHISDNAEEATRELAVWFQ